MLVIRLQRVGRKNDPSFRVVLMDKRRAAKAGKAVEFLGSYSSRQKTSEINEERVKYWLSQGAKSSETVHNILVSKNIISGPKIDVFASAKASADKSAKPKEKVEEKAEN